MSADLTSGDAPQSSSGVVAQSSVHSMCSSTRRPSWSERRSVKSPPSQWDAMMALNLRAPFLLAQAAAPHLRDAHGAIVNIADLAAFETWPAYIPHGISKSGIVYMTRALARTLAPNVRVNGIAPGAVLLPEGWTEEDAAKLARLDAARATRLTRRRRRCDAVLALAPTMSPARR